ncbi:MAG: hypothetical protein KGD73_13935, partial [Candidatus Lokiarchaeota archaeon]|nr:hypothetical protein [Candidatus Lokiarchaeota archaeon]
PYMDVFEDIMLTSFLIDLYLSGNISFEEKKVKIITLETSNQLLDVPLKNLLTKKEGADASHIVGIAILLLNQATGPFTQREIYKNFVNQGVLRDETGKFPKLYFNKGDIQQKLISDIKNTTLGVDKPNIEDYYVLRMLKMGHRLKIYFSKPEIKEINALLEKDLSEIGIEENLADLIMGIIKGLRRRHRAH